MAELYLFSQYDELLTILSEETGLISAPLRRELNQVSSEPFSFTFESDVERAKFIKEENRVVFKDREGKLREYVIKEIDDINDIDGPETTAICIPSFVEELNNNVVVDRRFVDKEAQVAMDAALENTRFIGIVEVSLGEATTNFYYISSLEAVFDIRETWGGDIDDVVYLSDDETHIARRELRLVQRLGADRGVRFEIDHNIDEIERTILSYPYTALYGRGSSLEVEDDEGEHTGGYTRYIDFADVEWKESKGDPVDKPKGQKWVGDPDALQQYGYEKDNGLLHRYGIFSNQDYEEEDELLYATWEHLQKAKYPEVNYKLSVDLLDKEVELGDTAVAIDREFSRPIELQNRIIAIEYDLVDIENTTVVEIGQFLNLRDDIQSEIEDIKDKVNRPTKPINENSFPDKKPSTPINIRVEGGIEVIQLYWDYADEIFIKHYEVYGSQIKDFTPDEQHLLWRGQVSAFGHKIDTDEKWYYRIRAVSYRGKASDWSKQVEGSTRRILNDDILFGEITADKLAENLDLAGQLSDGTLDWINDEPLYQIQQTENRILTDVGDRIGDILNDIDLIGDDLEELHYQDVEINNRIDGLSTIVQDTKFDLNDLTDEVEHQSTQISSWEQRADGFEQSVVDVQGDLENAFTEISLIEQTAKDLTFSVGELEGNLDEWGVGNRNLFSVESLEGTGNNYISYVSPELPKDTEKVTCSWNGEHNSLFIELEFYEKYEAGEFVNRTGRPETLFYESKKRIVELPAGTRYLKYHVTGTSGDRQKIYDAKIKIEAGEEKTAYSLAPEDMSGVNRALAFINISKDGLRLHGEKVHISGQTLIDEGVIGSAAIAELAVDKFHLKYGIIDDVHINEMSGEKIIAHSINVDKLNVDELSAVSGDMGTLTAGILRSDNNNMELNLNRGTLRMSNADFTLGGGADIHFSNVGNRLYYQQFDDVGRITRSAGFGVGRSISDRFPYAFLGATNTSKPNARDDENFTGFIVNTLQRSLTDGIGNSVVGNVFDVRDEAVSFRTGIRFNLTGSVPSVYPLSASSISYDIGKNDNWFRRIYVEDLRNTVGYFAIRNKNASTQGLRIETGYDGKSQMVLRKIHADDSYNLGSSSHRFSYVYLRYQPNVSSDGRLKRDIKDNVLGLDFINDLDTKSFIMNDDDTSTPQLGLIAQDVLSVMNNHNASDLSIVSKGDDEYYGMQTTQLIIPTIKSVQDVDLKFSNKIVNLEDRLDEKDLEIQYLKQKIKLLEEKVA